MWDSLKTAVDDGHIITGIVNPNSGPDVPDNGLNNYRYALNVIFNKGEDRADPDSDIAALKVKGHDI